MHKQIRRASIAVAFAAATTMAATTAATAVTDPGAEVPRKSGASTQYGLIERIAGRDRVETAIETSKAMDKTHDVDTVIVTRGDLFPDALATVPLADVLNAPVLLNNLNANSRNHLDARVANEIKRLGATKVIILGDQNSVGTGAERALENIVGVRNVERVGGVDRYETAYKLAADTVAAMNPSTTQAQALARAKAALKNIELAERAYQEALAEYQAASQNFANARLEYKAAQEAYNAQLIKITELARTLRNVPNVPAGYASWDAYIAEAQVAFTTANSTHARNQAALSFLATELGAIEQQGETTLDIKSTLGEYKTKFPQLVAGINNAQAVFGLNDATTLEDALTIATTRTNASASALPAAAKELSERVAEMQAAAAAVEANKPILEQLGRENVTLAGLANTLAAKTQAYRAAANRLAAAQDRLANATANRPAPGHIEDATTTVANARDAVVRTAGRNSAFVADGNVAVFALAAGTAAAKQNGVVLLSQGGSLGTWARKYVALSNSQTVGVGLKGSNAVGTNTTKTFRSANANQVANQMGREYFGSTDSIAVASSNPWPDSLTGGSFIAQYDGLLLTTETNSLNEYAADYVKFSAKEESDVDIRIFGARINDDVYDELVRAIRY